GHTHSVEQINNPRRRLAHGFDGRLIAEKVAAVNRVIKMLPGSVALAFQIFGRVDAALRANRVRAFYRHDGKQVDVPAHFGDLDDCREPCQSATYHDDFWSCHSFKLPAFP